MAYISEEFLSTLDGTSYIKMEAVPFPSIIIVRCVAQNGL